MSDQDSFFMKARPQIRVFVAKNGNLQVDVTQIDEEGEETIFDFIHLPMDCVEAVAKAMMRLAR